MTRPRTRLLLAAVLALSVAACTAPDPDPGPSAPPSASPAPDPTTTSAEPSPTPTTPETVFGTGVSAGHPAAVAAGSAILEAGGNAVDAAVAASFAVSVVEPFASGIGGGGATLVAGPDVDPVAYDYREQVAQDGRIPDSGTGVPGHVAGMAALHADYGQLEWSEVLQPAIDLAEDGFAVSEFLALRMRSDFGPAAVAGSATFSSSGGPLAAGETLVQPALAASLRTIADDGAESFYTGSIADALTGVDGLDAGTLADYEVVEGDPVAGEFAGHEVLSAAPALPGVSLVQMLQVAEAAGIADVEPGSADYVETLSRAWLVGNETASTVLGDPRFVDVPVDDLTDPGANAGRVEQAATDVVVDPDAPPVEAGNTTHLTVVDDDGLVVSMTNTITSFWGSGQEVGGFFLNDQLSRFASYPSPANSPEPGRRSVSWAAPTLVLDADGAPVLGIGSPGGLQIPSILANVLVRYLVHGQPLADAVDAPRFILTDGVLTAEESLSGEAAAGVGALGWEVRRVTREQAVFGSVQALAIDPETGAVTGAVDPRREADVAVTDP